MSKKKGVEWSDPRNDIVKILKAEIEYQKSLQGLQYDHDQRKISQHEVDEALNIYKTNDF